MISSRTLALTAFGLFFASTPLAAQDLSRYRDFALGSTVASITKASGARPDEVKVIHQRPATIQELRWRPQARYAARLTLADPVREVVFSFYNDQLFQIVVDYDRQGTEGLTDSDVIESMTAIYGTPALRTTNFATGTRATEPEGDAVVARWTSADASLTLLRGTYPTNLRFVMVQKSLAALAGTASEAALQQAALDAPQLEIDRQKRIVEDRRVALDKARTANKLAFKP